MGEILEQINSLLYLSLKIDKENNDYVIWIADELEDIKDDTLTSLIQFFIKLNAIDKVVLENQNGNKRIKLLLKKANISKEKLASIDCDSIREVFNKNIDNATYFLTFLLIALKINGSAELDIKSELTRLELEGKRSQVLDVPSLIYTVKELTNNMAVCKKYVNHMNCDKRPIENLEDIHAAALEYSEGSEALRNLLESLFKNKINTLACCKGHGNKQITYGYVLFDLDDSKTNDFFQNLRSTLLEPTNGDIITEPPFGSLIPGYENCYIDDSSVSFDSSSADKLLRDILLYIEEYNNEYSNDIKHKL